MEPGSRAVTRKEVRDKIADLLGSTIKLSVALFFVHMLKRVLGGLSFEAFGIEILTDHLLAVLNIAIIAYFGYRVLTSLEFMLDMTVSKLASVMGLKKTTRLKRMGYDIVYLITLILVWFALSPLVSVVPGASVQKLLSILFLALAAFFVYDFARILYDLFKERFEALVNTLTSIITRGLEEREAS